MDVTPAVIDDMSTKENGAQRDLRKKPRLKTETSCWFSCPSSDLSTVGATDASTRRTNGNVRGAVKHDEHRLDTERRSGGVACLARSALLGQDGGEGRGGGEWDRAAKCVMPARNTHRSEMRSVNNHRWQS